MVIFSFNLEYIVLEAFENLSTFADIGATSQDFEHGYLGAIRAYLDFVCRKHSFMTCFVVHMSLILFGHSSISPVRLKVMLVFRALCPSLYYC